MSSLNLVSQWADVYALFDPAFWNVMRVLGLILVVSAVLMLGFRRGGKTLGKIAAILLGACLAAPTIVVPLILVVVDFVGGVLISLVSSLTALF